jgi:hypothetical protein
MSATILHNPDNVPGAVTSGYQRQNTVLFASMTGFSNLNLDRNLITAGSVFEINGAIFRCLNDETINNLESISHSTIFYIYAEPINANELMFYARNTNPDWNVLKGGYYINNNRALIKAIKNQNGDVEAVKMNSILTNVNSVVPPNSGGNEVITRTVKTHESYHGEAGWYRFDIKSGLGGGNGGSHVSGSNAVTAGGVPSNFNSFTGVFYHSGGAMIIHVGGNG